MTRRLTCSPAWKIPWCDKAGPTAWSAGSLGFCSGVAQWYATLFLLAELVLVSVSNSPHHRNHDGVGYDGRKRPWQKGTNPSDTSINYELGLVVVEGQGIGEWKSTEAGLRWTSWEYESRPRWIVRLQNLPDQMVIRSGFCFGVSRTTQP